MVESEADSGVRLAELIAALSLGIDLGLGQPMEHILRECAPTSIPATYLLVSVSR